MDLRLPGLSGVDAIRTIRQTHPELRFIVLTTYDGDEDIHRALDAGAQAYLLKAMSHAEVTSAIRKVHLGSRVIPEPVSRTLAGRAPHSDLSPREIEVLELIAKGLSNKEIGQALGIAEATVKWHVSIILGRLNVADRTEALVAAAPAGDHAPAMIPAAVSLALFAMASPIVRPPEPADDSSASYSRRVWQSADGLPEDLAQAFAQTPDGYLWIGTSGGLVRFDGVRFVVFNRATEPAFRDDSIYSLLTTSDGALWAGTEGGGLVRYQDGSFPGLRPRGRAHQRLRARGLRRRGQPPVGGNR